VAFGSGDLWKSTDHGVRWKPIFENQASHGIGDIALAPSDHDILYVGTGESLRKQRNFTLPGNGIYRSADGGETWEHRGLSQNWHVGEIVVHPDNPDIVFVAAMGRFWTPDNQQGIYKTIDGGKNWKRVLYVDQNTRANDIVIAPSNPDIVYATMWENNIDTTLFESVYGKNSSAYKSIDGGETWHEISTGLPQGPKTGRIGIAVSYSNPNKAYVLIDNLNKERAKAPEIYSTSNGGDSWMRTHRDDLLFSSVIGWYFSDIYVNPQNDEEIFALGVRIARSIDGGKSIEYLGGEVQHINPSPAQTLHLDHCELWINPENPNHLAVGNDGGFYDSYDKGKTWTHYNNIPAGEFYTITLENRAPYRIFGGTQDDATVFGSAEEYKPAAPDPWQYLWIDAWSGGDGCVTQLDPDDPNTIYFSMQEGNIWRKDVQADTAISVQPMADTLDEIQLNYNFVSPYFVSTHQGQTLYHAGNYVYKSTDKGDHWQRISPDLSQSKYRAKNSLAASAFCESPLEPGNLYLGTDHGAFYISKDDGKQWEEKSEGLANNYLRSICPSRFIRGKIYLAMTGLDYDDLGAYVYVSENHGENWRLISSDLPDQPINVVIEDPRFSKILYVGTHRGVFLSTDGGDHWQLLGSEFPLVPVADLAINHANELIVATHGRGIYKIDLSPIYVLHDSDVLRKSTPYLFSVLDFKSARRRATHKDVDLSSVEKQNFYFYLPGSGVVKLSIEDQLGEKIWQNEVSGKRGINGYRWDQILSTEASLEPYFINYEKYITPGSYKLILNFEGTTVATDFEVLMERTCPP
jgi:photosystem II stability/assembly factor-like uncharacterized protein